MKTHLRLIPLLLCCVTGVLLAVPVQESTSALASVLEPRCQDETPETSAANAPTSGDHCKENKEKSNAIPEKNAAPVGAANLFAFLRQMLATNETNEIVPAPTPVTVTVPVTGSESQDAPESPSTSPTSTPSLSSPSPALSSSSSETRISALRIYGTTAVDVVADGEVELQRDALTLTADRLTYRESTDEVLAEGNVRLRQDRKSEMSGPSATLVIGARTGEFVEPEYSMTRVRPPLEEGDPPRLVSGGGKADLLQLEGENKYRAKNASWSTCPAPNPDWYFKAGELEIDYDREIGVARDSTVVFKDVPFFWLPWAEFPLAGQRHSGLLPPTMESSTNTGFGFSLPWYWNIAPNYDFTLTPRYMSRRGLQMGAETRYLGTGYNGTMRAEYLPRDNITGEARSLGSLQHAQWLAPSLYASLDINAVSDDRYFEDLSTRVSMSSKVNLLREGRLIYSGGGGWWSASLLAQSYQTLSPDPDNPVTTPYRRLPQFTLNAMRPAEFQGLFGSSGIDLAWQSEFVRFTHPMDNHPDASRLTAYPQISLPLQWSGFYITPKFGAHVTRYNFDRNHDITGMRDTITRSVPIFSLDSGLNFERETRLFGRDYTQTLEPRLYYLKTAYRRQDDIPLFDTSRYDFGFAQIFSENLYTGSDRIADANQVTAAVTTRLIDPVNGIERLRLVLGQRYYFDEQRVTLNYRDENGILQEIETPRTSKRADVLAGFSGKIGKNASVESLWQYNPRDHQTERYTATLRYNPGYTRALNLSYRYARDILRDVDISGQWPLWGKWYGVTRLTHSLKEDRLTEIIGGLEYNGGCWVLRMGGHRYATRENKFNNAYFLQLELNDFTSIGPGGNVVNMIKRSVPGYGKINEPAAGNSFGD